MAIVRFLNKDLGCHHLQSPKTSMLIHLSTSEREQLLNGSAEASLIVIASDLSKEEAIKHMEALQTKTPHKEIL